MERFGPKEGQEMKATEHCLRHERHYALAFGYRLPRNCVVYDTNEYT